MERKAEEELRQWRERGRVVHVRLTNRTAYFLEYPQEVLRHFLRYHPPGYFFAPSYRARAWDGYIGFLKRNSCPTGLLLQQLPEIRKATGLQFRFTDDRSLPQFRKIKSSEREFQNECIRIMQKRSRTGGIILAATGTGKTFVAGKYFQSLAGTGVFIVDELTLLTQTKADMERVLGEEVGFIGDRKFDPRRITVGTIQTIHLHRRDPRFVPWIKRLDVVIFDELHQALSKRNLDSVKGFMQPKAIFGLTATLETKKKPVMMRAAVLCGPVIYEYPLEQGVREGHLTPGICVALDMERNGKSLPYQDAYKSLVVRSRQRNDMLEAIIREGVRRGNYVCTLVEHVDHVHRISDRLEGLPHREVYGDKKVYERIKAKKDFDAGKIRALVANKVFKKGVDIKKIDVIVDAASMAGRNDAKQKFGRGVRLADDKSGLIYFDVGDRNKDPNLGRGDKGWNRFERTSRRRRRAFKDLGIPIMRYVWDGNVKRLYRKAEKVLAKWVRKVDRTRTK